MNSLTKISAVVGVASFAGIFVWGLIFQALLRLGILRNPDRIEPYIKTEVFFLFCVFGFCCMPLLMRVFIAGQHTIGNTDVGMVRFLREHFVGVTLGFWAFLLLGLLVALPVMWTDFFGFKPGVGKSQGVLRANVGMTFADVAAASTLKMPAPVGPGVSGAYQCVDDVVFDFEIPTTGMRFDRCRYYFMETGPKGDPHIESINIGVSQVKTNRTDIDAALARIRQQLQTDRWRVGYFIYRTREEQVLHGKISSERDERYWSKNNTVLVLSTRRMDEEAAGEDPRTAGEFIVVIDLESMASAMHLHLHLQFEPPAEPIPLIP